MLLVIKVFTYGNRIRIFKSDKFLLPGFKKSIYLKEIASYIQTHHFDKKHFSVIQKESVYSGKILFKINYACS